MERVMRNKWAIFIFLFPSIALFTFIIIAPIFLSSYYSTLKWDGIGEQVFVGFDNYARLFADPLFMKSVQNTVTFAIASVLIQLPIALLLALILSGKIKGERFFVTVYFIPVILSSVVIGHLWMRIYNTKYGLLNLLLNALGLTQAGRTVWLGDMRTALGAVVVPILWQYIGYHMLLFYSGIKSIPDDIFEAAKIDGAGFWSTAFSVTIPLLKPILQVSLTFAVVGSMKVFDLVKVLTDGGPANASEVISTLLVRTMIYPGNNYGYGSAMAMALIAICFALYYLLAHLFRDKSPRLERRNAFHE